MQTKVLKNGYDLAGIGIRTTNAAEMNPKTAKIAKLWQDFWQLTADKLPENLSVYGVYTNYESDYTGEFDVFACTDNQPLADIAADTQKVHILAGNYLTFSASGEMPQMVIDVWSEIWQYFNAADCPHQRAYTTDFEYYKSDSEVEISISIK